MPVLGITKLTSQSLTNDSLKYVCVFMSIDTMHQQTIVEKVQKAYTQRLILLHRTATIHINNITVGQTLDNSPAQHLGSR